MKNDQENIDESEFVIHLFMPHPSNISNLVTFSLPDQLHE